MTISTMSPAFGLLLLNDAVNFGLGNPAPKDNAVSNNPKVMNENMRLNIGMKHKNKEKLRES